VISRRALSVSRHYVTDSDSELSNLLRLPETQYSVPPEARHSGSFFGQSPGSWSGGGFGQLAGKIFRVDVMGPLATKEHVDELVACFGEALQGAGYRKA